MHTPPVTTTTTSLLPPGALDPDAPATAAVPARDGASRAPSRASSRASRPRRVLAVVGRGLAVALLVGTAGGLAARLWMRLFSVVLGHETGFSWQGTAGIVMVFTIGVLPGALVAAATTRRLRRVPLALGLLFLWFATGVTAVQEDLPSGLTATEAAGLLAVGLAFLLTPVAQVWAVARLADRRRRTR